MNKLSSLLICILLVTGISMMHGETSFTIGKFTYTVVDESQNFVSVAAKYGTAISGNVTIPETVENGTNTYTITQVGLFESLQFSSITLPSTISRVTGSAFSNCENLQTVIFNASDETIIFGTAVFDRCSSLSRVILPSKLQSIPANTFKSCVLLESIIIPSSVTGVAYNAFNNCNNLQTIISLPETAPTLNADFTGITKSNITLYVPSEAAEASYAANTYWTGWKEVKIHSIDVSDQVDNTVILSEHNGNMISVDLIRTLHPESYNSICLPFDLSEEQVESLFGTECKLQELTYASVSDESLELNFTASDHLEAGKPYLIQPSISVTNPFVVNAVISNNLVNCDLGDVQFVGSFSPVDLPNSENILFLKDNNTLYLSQGGQLPGLRAYFRLQSSAAKTAAAKRIVMRTDDAVTTISNPDSPAASIITKQLIDGQFLILRDGQCFSLQGQRLK